MTRTSVIIDGRTYEFVCLSSLQELEGYWGQWSALVASDSQRTIFNSPEMFVASRKALPERDRPHVVFVRREGETLACAPMVISREKVHRIPYRTLKFHMPRADCVAPQDRRQVVAALVRYWRGVSSQWDILALEELPDGCETLAVLGADVPNWRGYRSLPVGPTGTETFLPTDGTWDEYSKGRTRHFRNRWSRIRRAADETKHLSIVMTRSPRDADSALGDLFALEERSWKLTGGARLTAGERAAFLELAHATGGNLSYEVKFVEVQGEKIAGLLSYFHFDRAYLFVTFFDQRYDRVSPGRLVMGTCVEQAFHDPAIKEVSFVGSYAAAQAWSSTTRDYRSIRVYGRSLAARLAYVADRRKLSKTT